MFSSRFQYSIIILLDLAKTGTINTVSGKDIAKRNKIPTRWTELILVDLTKAGLVRSTRGPGGGYQLAIPLTQINLYEVKRAIKEFEKADHYWAEYAVNTDEVVDMKAFSRLVINNYRDLLKQTKVSDLVNMKATDNEE